MFGLFEDKARKQMRILCDRNRGGNQADFGSEMIGVYVYSVVMLAAAIFGAWYALTH